MLSCTPHVHESLWQSAWESPHELKNGLTDREWNWKPRKGFPLRLIENTTLVSSCHSKWPWSEQKTPLRCIFSTFPLSAGFWNWLKVQLHSSQGQGQANLREDIKFQPSKKNLASPPRHNVYSCGWHRMAPSVNPQNKSFWQSQNSPQILKKFPKTYSRTTTQISFPFWLYAKVILF